MKLLEGNVEPDFEEFEQCVLALREPDRVHHVEFLLDEDVIASVAERFGLARGVDPEDLEDRARRDMEVYALLGYDVFPVALSGFTFPINWVSADDPTNRNAQRETKRSWIEEHRGPFSRGTILSGIPGRGWRTWTSVLWNGWSETCRDGMKAYCWNDQAFERTSGLLGYESLCFKLHDDRELVEAVAGKVGELGVAFTELLCEFSCVGVIWDSDDMAFRSQTLLPPDVLRKLFLPWHKKSGQIAHRYGKLYFLHACGNVEAIMEDLIGDVGIDAKHSFEDAIMPVTEAVAKYGSRIGILGGIDLDFLCRSSEEKIRQRVRATLEACHPGGGYCWDRETPFPTTCLWTIT